MIPPSSDGAPYRVEATIRNTGRGHGEVAVTVRLRDDRAGRSVETDRKLDLEEHETTLLVADVPAPPCEYTPDVESSTRPADPPQAAGASQRVCALCLKMREGADTSVANMVHRTRNARVSLTLTCGDIMRADERHDRCRPGRSTWPR